MNEGNAPNGLAFALSLDDWDNFHLNSLLENYIGRFFQDGTLYMAAHSVRDGQLRGMHIDLDDLSEIRINADCEVWLKDAVEIRRDDFVKAIGMAQGAINVAWRECSEKILEKFKG